MNFFGWGRKKKVLIVEDEVHLAEGLEARLKLEGYDVELAADGQAGVERARQNRPDLIIMDVMMPHVDGKQACSIIKSDKLTKKIPILMLTALQTVGDTDDSFEAGADGYLSKPYSSQRLLEQVKKLLAQSR